MIADMDPVSTGIITAEFDKALFLGLEKREIQTFFRPRENTVSLEFKFETIVYRQIWNSQARETFKRAVKQYKQDFNDRILVDKHSSRWVYGKQKGKVEWSSTSLSLSETSTAQPQLDLGYTFKRGSPYFQVLMYEAPADKQRNDISRTSSRRIPIYYTIAQAEELAALFDQEWLISLLGPRGEDGYFQAERDEYQAKQSQNKATTWFGELVDGFSDLNPFGGTNADSAPGVDAYGSTSGGTEEASTEKQDDASGSSEN